MSTARQRIVLGVTSPMSLILMRGLPERLADEGWEVTVVSSPGAELDELERGGVVRTHAISMAREPSLVADGKALIAWWRFLRRLRPNVVFVGTPKAGMLGVLAGLLARVPARIYHLRGLRLETAHGAGRLIFRAVESLTLAAATSSVAVSNSLKQRVVELRLGRSRKIAVLGHGSSNGVDVGRFHPVTDAEADADRQSARKRLGLTADVPVIGYVGRIHPDKGVETLADASILLTARGVHHQILLVGGADHSSAQALVEKFRHLDSKAVLTGAVADVAPYYRVMDVHCLPTLREGFPNAVLEAAASGVATVTTEATGAVDSVVPGETGYIVAPQDREALADALEHALSDPHALSRLGRNAREWVIANYSREQVQADLSGFLQHSLNRVRGAS